MTIFDQINALLVNKRGFSQQHYKNIVDSGHLMSIHFVLKTEMIAPEQHLQCVMTENISTSVRLSIWQRASILLRNRTGLYEWPSRVWLPGALAVWVSLDRWIYGFHTFSGGARVTERTVWVKGQRRADLTAQVWRENPRHMPCQSITVSGLKTDRPQGTTTVVTEDHPQDCK